MKILISPAKSLNLEDTLPTTQATQPIFLQQATELNNVLKEVSPSKLSELMNISDKLAELNWKRNQDWTTPFTKNNARPAVFTFNGDVYTGLDAYSMNRETIDHMQKKLRILSGLYGLLKPLDLIQAYRLEMGTKFRINNTKNLYEFWKTTITKHINSELETGELLINLASNEYFKAVDKKNIKAETITPIFKDWKNDKLKVISFFAKKARGSMARYLIENTVEDLDTLKTIQIDGYVFSKEATIKENEPVFVR